MEHKISKLLGKEEKLILVVVIDGRTKAIDIASNVEMQSYWAAGILTAVCEKIAQKPDVTIEPKKITINYPMHNHEIYTTCPTCGGEYDARLHDVCPDCKEFLTIKK